MSNGDRGLFEIRAINKETDEAIYSTEIIAEGEKEALFEKIGRASCRERV